MKTFNYIFLSGLAKLFLFFPSGFALAVSAPVPAVVQTSSQPDASEAALAEIATSTKPAFTDDSQNKLSLYKRFLTLLTMQTKIDVIAKGLNGFLSDIVNPALMQTSLSLSNLTDIRGIVQLLIPALTTLANQLATAPKTDQRRIIVADKLSMLKSRLSDLEKKLAKQKAFQDLLDAARKLPNQPLADKISKYTAMLPKLDKDILDALKQTLVQDLAAIGDFVKTQGPTVPDIVKRLISSMQSSQFLTAQQKQTLAAIAKDLPAAAPVVVPAPQPTTAPTPVTPTEPVPVPVTPSPKPTTPVEAQPPTAAPAVTPPPVKGDSGFQSKLKEALARATLQDKIAGVKEMLGQVTATSSQDDKSSYIGACSDFFLNQGLMKKAELTSLQDLFTASLTNTFLFTPEQQKVMTQWQKTVTLAQEFAQENDSLVTGIKKIILAFKDAYGPALKATFYAINLFNTRLAPDELDKSNPNSLLTVLRTNIPALYNNRAGKKLEEFKALDGVLTAALAQKATVDIVGKTWKDTVALDVALLTAQQQTDMTSKITTLQAAGKLVSAKTDRYERSLYTDMLATIFVSRSERSAKELEAFSVLLGSLTTQDFQKTKAFENADFDKFKQWANIISVTLSLLQAPGAKPASKRFEILAKAQPLLGVSGVDYEKKLFAETFGTLFAQRVTLTDVAADSIKQFLVAVQAAKDLLPANNVAMLNQWLSEVNKTASPAA